MNRIWGEEPMFFFNTTDESISDLRDILRISKGKSIQIHGWASNFPFVCLVANLGETKQVKRDGEHYLTLYGERVELYARIDENMEWRRLNAEGQNFTTLQKWTELNIGPIGSRVSLLNRVIS